MSGDERKRYELRDAFPLPILGFGFGLALIIALSMWLVAYITATLAEDGDLRDGEKPNPLADVRPIVREPLLQASPSAELTLHAQEIERRLTSYAWIDREDGLVSIPIERAMQQLLEEGLPTRPAEDGR